MRGKKKKPEPNLYDKVKYLKHGMKLKAVLRIFGFK